LNYGDNL